MALIENWDKKRKLLTFFEEIALLVNSNQINKNVAIYMFGYYIQCALHGNNFCTGIDPSPKHWTLLYAFLDDIEKYFNTEDGKHPPLRL